MYSHWNNLFLNHTASYSLIHRFASTWVPLSQVKMTQRSTTWSPDRPLVIHVVQGVDVTVIGQQLIWGEHFPFRMMGGNARALALAPGSATDSMQPWANHYRTAPKPVLWLPDWSLLGRHFQHADMIRLFPIHACRYHITPKQKQ